ncbi:MAG: hypothetical protein H3C40_12400 [Ignavibacterium sp.]|nr:hypothetical protein [Ignavibacterium sp.]
MNLFSTLDCQQSINNLVEICFKIALSHLRFNYKKVHRIILRDEISLEDIAIDSITSLFERDQMGCFKNILEPFNSWQPPIKTEEEALFFLTKLVQKRADQHISHLLRESDPLFSKLADSVNYLLKKYSYRKTSYFGTIFIINSLTENISGKTIPIEEFEKLPAKLFTEKKNLLQNIFLYLNSETSYVSAIPFNALIHKLKELNTALYNISESTTEQNDNIEINSIVAQALNKTIQKLDDTYISKEKLSMDEGEKFRKALMDISRDIKDGGVNPGLYKYLLAHIQALDEETYKQKYHNILEYLLKVLKQNIADELVQ